MQRHPILQQKTNKIESGERGAATDGSEAALSCLRAAGASAGGALAAEEHLVHGVNELLGKLIPVPIDEHGINAAFGAQQCRRTVALLGEKSSGSALESKNVLQPKQAHFLLGCPKTLGAL